MNDRSNEAPPLTQDGTRKVVISIHGIRTHAPWQKTDLTKALNLQGIVHIPLDYGFFRALKLLTQKRRRKQIDWFLEQYTTHSKDSDGPPSIIAHSFGTYLVARSMEIYEEIAFDRIILCGSIVNTDYDWSTRLDNGQCRAVLNDFGQMDFWASKAKYVMEDGGDSGVNGFDEDKEEKDVRLTQRAHPEWRHSDFFYKLNYEKNWIPFLLGEEPQKLTSTDRPSKRRKNPYFRTARAILVIAVVLALALLGWWYLTPTQVEEDPITFPEMAAVYNAPNFVSKLDEYQKQYRNKQIKWYAIIVQPVSPDAFQIAPLPPALSSFKVRAKYDPGYKLPMDNGQVVEDPRGKRVKIQAVIDDVYSSGVRLRNLKVLCYLH